MDDLNSMLTSILGDPGKMEQLRQVAQSIGLSPGGAAAPSGQPDGGSAAPGGFDPSAVASLLQNLQGSGNAGSSPPAGGGASGAGNGPSPAAIASLLQGLQGGGNAGNGAPPAGGNAGGGFDPSAFASLLQNLQGGGNAGAAPSAGGGAGGGFDPAALSSILGMLGGGQNAGGAAGGGMPDLGSIGKLAGVLGTMNQPDKNIDLLQALKPHFSPERAGKIDGAVRLMRLMHAWPAVRDSGLLGSLGNLFSGGGKR
mgnify:CR=1 FL=1